VYQESTANACDVSVVLTGGRPVRVAVIVYVPAVVVERTKTRLIPASVQRLSLNLLWRTPLL
jgi:hypothetical protein